MDWEGAWVNILRVDMQWVIISGILLGETPYKYLNLLREVLGTYSIVYQAQYHVVLCWQLPWCDTCTMCLSCSLAWYLLLQGWFSESLVNFSHFKLVVYTENSTVNIDYLKNHGSETAHIHKVLVFWAMSQWWVVNSYWYFRGACFLHLLGLNSSRVVLWPWRWR